MKTHEFRKGVSAKGKVWTEGFINSVVRETSLRKGDFQPSRGSGELSTWLSGGSALQAQSVPGDACRLHCSNGPTVAGGKWTTGGKWGQGINSLSKTEMNCVDVDGTRGSGRLNKGQRSWEGPADSRTRK